MVRWIQFHQEADGEDTISFAWIITVEAIHSLGGFLDVSLFLLTRRDLLLFGNIRAPVVLDPVADTDGCNVEFYPLGRLPSPEQTQELELPDENSRASLMLGPGADE